jgi:hypothetical protein
MRCRVATASRRVRLSADRADYQYGVSIALATVTDYAPVCQATP